ncbi:8-amino-3,8-dideoxy-alpha-D-manno-octulosonate transaminase [Ensifer adhaerens]|uniref:dTDP-4-amino-4,6-dideoxygalactose transaminase n=1 Tax=Ensifer adhaerens TaxID=106592 RepID=A0ACC5SX61_ENSAD|nr:aminotransferase class I/II-fold pyridoxal phosphate-dependent enzyme [Ensifer adhaerens]MBP1872984.1 dTDP-4-amino-4,6-dideoxygalactose transaminase [Ensifer adhaerens]NRP22467.1 8-amino-3,8-dideoxy-alpha-D-manno-octulosonate transaminase [Ensifer adhaerens]
MARVGMREWLALAPVFASGKLARFSSDGNGPLTRFEADFSAKFGVEHVLTVSSGTGALIAALAAAGVGPGDEVLVPAYTWIATAGAALAVGAVPIIVEIDETLTMDPADILRKITPYTRAIIPVHMANMVCDMERIMQIARDHGLIVVEDACQAVGLPYKGVRVGTIGDAGAFSFNQFKNINIGEGGAVVTNDPRLFARARMYHDIGALFRGHLDNANEPPMLGINLKASQIQGAMLNVQLKKLDPMIRRMRRHYDAIAEILSSSNAMRIGPHNDQDNAAGLHVIFDTAEEAQAFAAENKRGVYRLYDSSRHVYSNWLPVLEQRTANPKMNPYAWTSRKIEYAPDMCPRSLDILKRTCRIGLGENYPLPLMTYFARRMVRQRPAAKGSLVYAT